MRRGGRRRSRLSRQGRSIELEGSVYHLDPAATYVHPAYFSPRTTATSLIQAITA